MFSVKVYRRDLVAGFTEAYLDQAGENLVSWLTPEAIGRFDKDQAQGLVYRWIAHGWMAEIQVLKESRHEAQVCGLQ